MSKNRWARLAYQLGLIVLFTLILIELAARLFWWNQPVMTVYDRELFLIPLPLLSQKQREILRNWQNTPDSYLQFDSVLGWSIRPEVQADQEGITYTSNQIGLRSLREYSLEKEPGRTRIVTMGASFTHGDEAPDQGTWQAQLEQTRPDLEVMNWGVGGYGTDQALLRYETQAAAYQPDIVIIGFEENNIWRNVNRFRPFQHHSSGIPLTKPVFVLEQGRLNLVANPFTDFETLQDTLLNQPNRFLEMVCPHDYFCDQAKYQQKPLDVLASFRFFRTLAYEVRTPLPATRAIVQTNLSSTDWRLNEVEQTNWLLVQMFVESVIRHNATPIILAFPERFSIEAMETGQQTFYQQSVTFLEQQGVSVIELTVPFVDHKLTNGLEYTDYYAPDGGHFNALGNAIVSQAVLRHLCQQGFLQNCS
ncbi:MAG: SGNH/GDSL hydrolase family protein [Anaerolineae bacterium]|nr:SGNH/GDSL hydrolase family protein [Anaerolineae bacterium]